MRTREENLQGVASPVIGVKVKKNVSLGNTIEEVLVSPSWGWYTSQSPCPCGQGSDHLGINQPGSFSEAMSSLLASVHICWIVIVVLIMFRPEE